MHKVILCMFRCPCSRGKLITQTGAVAQLRHITLNKLGNQSEYYEAINTSNAAGSSTAFIEFMLSIIKASLIDAIKTSDKMSDGVIDKTTLRWMQIEQYLETHKCVVGDA